MVYTIGAEKVHINYNRNGELDLASLKALARILGTTARNLSFEMRRN